MITSSRRTFLVRSSGALAGAALLPQWAKALPMQDRQPVSELLPEIMDPDLLRELALAGVGAASQPDISYSDVRVANSRELMIRWDFIGDVPMGAIKFEYSYGVRVKVGGAWGFAFGTDPTVDGIVRAVRSAAETARGLARLSAKAIELSSVPIVQGDWESKVAIDPFNISPDDHGKMLGAFSQSAGRVLGGGTILSTEWNQETRVFASSEGSILTQRLLRVVPNISVLGRRLGSRSATLPVPGIVASNQGFELLSGEAVQERIKETAEEAVRLASYPQGDAEVGRYEAVVDGRTFGALINATLVPALELDRVLGYEADGVGTSFLAPAREVLGHPLFSPVISLTANRGSPYLGSVKWDDEGVEAKPFALIEKGCVVDYLTTRDSAPELSDWYVKRGKQSGPHGSAVSCSPTVSPVGAASNLLVNSDNQGTDLDAMIKQINNGILVRGGSGIKTDPQLSGGTGYASMLYEIKNGQIKRRLINGMIQFGTKALLKNITQLGNSGTVGQHVMTARRGETLSKSYASTYAPAACLRQLDVTRFPKGY